MKDREAFTLAELLVVIAISGTLGALLLPSLASEKSIVVRAACAQNERQLALAWQMFANDHNGKVGIVIPGGGGGWLWDTDIPTRDMLVTNYGVPRKIFYCPSNPAQDQDMYWTCIACGSGGVGGGASTAEIGYWLLIQRVNPSNFQPITTTPWGGQTMMQYVGDPKYKFVYDLSHSSDPHRPLQVLLADAVISESNPFDSVPSGVGGPTFQSPHLGADGNPEGSNVCYTDGHVEWRTFTALRIRYVPNASPTYIYHWW